MSAQYPEPNSSEVTSQLLTPQPEAKILTEEVQKPFPKKLFIFLLFGLFFVGGGLFAAKKLLNQIKTSEKASTTETTTQAEAGNPFEEMSNPFIAEAASPFSDESDYENPFSDDEEDEEYQNPFGELR